MTEILDMIETELERIGADEAAAGPGSIGVNDELDGWASLGATEERRDFYWYGPAAEILERLRAVETGGGRDAVCEEFHTEGPTTFGPDGR